MFIGKTRQLNLNQEPSQSLLLINHKYRKML